MTQLYTAEDIGDAGAAAGTALGPLPQDARDLTHALITAELKDDANAA